MYARSTTIQAQPSAIDDGIAHMRDVVLPELQEIPGCVGLSLMVDRTNGRCIATSSWETEEAMHASAERVGPIRERAIALFGGSAHVEEWEIAGLHRAHRTHEGACVRATWVKTDPSRIDAAVEVYKAATLPAMEELDGFCSASLMINRRSGRAVSCTTYDDAEAMRRSREQSAALRVDAARQTGVEALDVREFELALAHLRVPEMA
ncbi:antibiotic biosynthesis monooxygenase [Nocardia cyriacigeorgica]|uniref:antibiotic biosynthesis monooxygenase n=1 Tax=Nocardia cyriacigeorgica TaxID=135487 RepID=UPI00189578CA|nr:antibiotic biosynthesis monooxygenase [Nocardia cyriacigeorgica]MBF6426347.1 antibiotic biosynthesis monooxygenase [Nocardia cyriacigeorgica]